MHLDEQRINDLAHRIADEKIGDRHRKRTQQEYETIFRIKTTRDSGHENLDLIFKRIIQARATPLNRDQYQEILEQTSPGEIIDKGTHQAAFDTLYTERHIGQKIANEFLRHVVDVFGIRRSDWGGQLDVALDTNVIQALVKTGAIVLEESERNRGTGQIINTNPNSDPTKLIPYKKVQDEFQQAANDAGFHRIVFDELWLEHREFISDPLLQSESVFFDFILDRYRY
ncbi:hypothetical protein [Haloarcula salina]|uniref:Uncharacterized protein n=1 Tax=Haloarcula salina TaxID=1429914 RepID=A0AA41G4L3_9EURY|nr:hypothetical protein [Haloarcula salina]MBV0903496.1 hypothetical protein [Haloarcula salina]